MKLKSKYVKSTGLKSWSPNSQGFWRLVLKTLIHQPGVEEMAARELTKTRELRDARRKRLIPVRAAIVDTKCKTFQQKIWFPKTISSILFLIFVITGYLGLGEMENKIKTLEPVHRYEQNHKFCLIAILKTQLILL